jgi:hypothetical protein
MALNNLRRYYAVLLQSDIKSQKQSFRDPAEVNSALDTLERQFIKYYGLFLDSPYGMGDSHLQRLFAQIEYLKKSLDVMRKEKDNAITNLKNAPPPIIHLEKWTRDGREKMLQKEIQQRKELIRKQDGALKEYLIEVIKIQGSLIERGLFANIVDRRLFPTRTGRTFFYIKGKEYSLHSSGGKGSYNRGDMLCVIPGDKSPLPCGEYYMGNKAETVLWLLAFIGKPVPKELPFCLVTHTGLVFRINPVIKRIGRKYEAAKTDKTGQGISGLVFKKH